MRILFLVDQFAGGGRERRMIQLVRGLDPNPSIDFHAIVFHDNIEYKEILQTRLTYDCIDKLGRKERCRRIDNIISEFRPDIVHSWVDTPTEMILLGKLKSKYGYRYIAGFVADANVDRFFSTRHLAMIYTFYKADIIISNSKVGLAAKRAPKSKSIVIYNGFDFSRIPVNFDPVKKKSELSISSKYLAVMFARINDAKDWLSFVHVADEAFKEGLDISFLAIGDGDKLNYYRNIVKDKKNIDFIGRRSDIEEILQITDVSFLFTNSKLHAEGVSNTIMESMSSGVPVIATRGGGTTEIIDHGVNGYIIEPGDYHTAYSIMKTLLTDKEKHTLISNNAVSTIRKRFSLDSMTSSYLTVYNKLIKA